MKKDDLKVYVIAGLMLILAIRRVILVKYFILEINEEIISIKYDHPLLKRFVPSVLELPLDRMLSYKLEQRLFSYKILIVVSSKQKVKLFNYELGFLPPSTAAEIQTWGEVHLNKKDLKNL